MGRGLQKVEFSVETPGVTHYGGMVLFQQFCRKLDLRRLFQREIPWQRRDGIYSGPDMLLCLIYTMVAGLQRISDTRILAYNSSFQKLLGLDRFPAENTLRNFLRSLSVRELEGLVRVHDILRSKMRILPRPASSYILDLDSTVLSVYGWTIEGTAIGYNPKKPGRPSYHPIVCFEGRTRDSIEGILRSGDTQPITAAEMLFRACLAKLPAYANRKKVSIRLRADAGFYEGRFIRFLDEKETDYIVVARMTAPLKESAEWADFRTFRKRGRWQVARTQYQPNGWKRPHRFIFVRRARPDRTEEASQLSLWEFRDFFYHAFVTNLDLKPAAAYRFYSGRANIELDIRELKEALALGKIPSTSFAANEVHFELILFAYDLVNWFRRLCLPGHWQRARLTTLRREVFGLPARLVRRDNKNVLRLPANYPHYRRFLRAAKNIAALRVP